MKHGLERSDFQSNRRSEARTPLSRRLDILPCAGRTQWKFLVTEMTECSPHGLGLLAGEPMAVGSQFLVKLKIGGTVKMLLYTVQNCTPAERARHRIGARFSGFAASELQEDPQKVMCALLQRE